MLRVGIVGLPNVGKSTLFNAVTRTHKAEAANYPFCTIEPNVGCVEVPDERLAILARLVHTEKIVPAAIEFVDIAGIVKDAYKGEGLGNQFLANIRETDAIIQVVRCFEDDDIVHTMGKVDPIRDIDVINTELLLADVQSVEKQVDTWAKKAKSNDKTAVATHRLLQRLYAHLNDGKPASTFDVNEEEAIWMKSFGLLTRKPVIYVCNVSEKDLSNPSDNPYVRAVKEKVASVSDTATESNSRVSVCVISAHLEAELSELSREDARAYLESLNLKESGADTLIRSAYKLLGLASYFTAGPQEVHAWTFKLGMKAPECAGIIHTDFQRGFIKAEVISYEDFVADGGFVGAREKGKLRLEGKDYCFQEGDIALFKFNVT